MPTKQPTLPFAWHPPNREVPSSPIPLRLLSDYSVSTQVLKYRGKHANGAIGFRRWKLLSCCCGLGLHCGDDGSEWDRSKLTSPPNTFMLHAF